MIICGREIHQEITGAVTVRIRAQTEPFGYSDVCAWVLDADRRMTRYDASEAAKRLLQSERKAGHIAFSASDGKWRTCR